MGESREILEQETKVFWPVTIASLVVDVVVGVVWCGVVWWLDRNKGKTAL